MEEASKKTPRFLQIKYLFSILGPLSLFLLLLVTVAASWINSRDEMRFALFPVSPDAGEVFESNWELKSTPLHADFLKHHSASPETFEDAISYYEDLAQVFIRAKNETYWDYDNIEESKFYEEKAKYYKEAEIDFVRRMRGELIFWNISPFILFISYSFGIFITRKSSSHYAPVFFLLVAYSLLTVRYAMNGPTDPDTAAHMHLFLIPIMFGVPIFVLFIGMNVSLFRNRKKKVQRDLAA